MDRACDNRAARLPNNHGRTEYLSGTVRLPAAIHCSDIGNVLLCNKNSRVELVMHEGPRRQGFRIAM